MLNNKENFIFWKFDRKIFKSEDYQLNNRIAKINSKKSFSDICEKYTHITLKNMEKVLKIERKISESIKGVGVDLGGGIGLMSSIIAKRRQLKKIYCVDIVKNAVIHCQPIIKKKVLGNKSYKVSSVIGSFDQLNLKSGSVDFCIAWDAMHHSLNIIKTLKEANRVLKKGGKLIIIDRGHNDETPDNEIKRMRNVVYSKAFLKENYLPLNKKLTRKMNGEHEYRFYEWENFFRRSRFKILKKLIVKESGLKNIPNKQKIPEKKVKFKIGGFERKKIIFLLQK